MALATYSDLQASIQSWSMRSDAPVTDIIKTAEARINREVRCRTLEPEEQASTVQGSRYLALPPLYSEPVQLWLEWPWGREELRFIPASEMVTSTAQSRPYYWTIDNGQIAFERPADQAYTVTLRFLEQFALSDTAPTNYVLTNYPDLYLSACLVETALWAQDDAQAERWQARYADALDSVNRQEGRSRALSTLSVDTALRHRTRFNIYSGDAQ